MLVTSPVGCLRPLELRARPLYPGAPGRLSGHSGQTTEALTSPPSSQSPVVTKSCWCNCTALWSHGAPPPVLWPSRHASPTDTVCCFHFVGVSPLSLEPFPQGAQPAVPLTTVLPRDPGRCQAPQLVNRVTVERAPAVSESPRRAQSRS